MKGDLIPNILQETEPQVGALMSLPTSDFSPVCVYCPCLRKFACSGNEDKWVSLQQPHILESGQGNPALSWDSLHLAVPRVQGLCDSPSLGHKVAGIG